MEIYNFNHYVNFNAILKLTIFCSTAIALIGLILSAIAMGD